MIVLEFEQFEEEQRSSIEERLLLEKEEISDFGLNSFYSYLPLLTIYFSYAIETFYESKSDGSSFFKEYFGDDYYNFICPLNF